MVNNNCDISSEMMKEQIISELIDMNVYKMPDGRQLYEGSLKELLQQYYSLKEKYARVN